MKNNKQCIPLYIAARFQIKEAPHNAQWFQLPLTKSMLGNGESVIADVALTEYSTSLPGYIDFNNASFSKVNHLASRLQKLSDDELLKLIAIMTGTHRFSKVEELINYTYNTKDYGFTPDITNESELAYRRLAELDFSGLPSSVKDSIDIEKFGKNTYWLENGRFAALGYISSKNDWWDEKIKEYRVPVSLDIKGKDSSDIFIENRMYEGFDACDGEDAFSFPADEEEMGDYGEE